MRQYRAAHDLVRGLIEARLMLRAELPLAEEQREALNEQLQLSSAVVSREHKVRSHSTEMSAG